MITLSQKASRCLQCWVFDGVHRIYTTHVNVPVRSDKEVVGSAVYHLLYFICNIRACEEGLVIPMWNHTPLTELHLLRTFQARTRSPKYVHTYSTVALSYVLFVISPLDENVAHVAERRRLPDP